jgi:hypothetical protein
MSNHSGLSFAEYPRLLCVIHGRCTYATLAPNVTYALGKATINITTTVVIVGNPAFPPLIDGSK